MIFLFVKEMDKTVTFVVSSETPEFPHLALLSPDSLGQFLSVMDSIAGLTSGKGKKKDRELALTQHISKLQSELLTEKKNSQRSYQKGFENGSSSLTKMSDKIDIMEKALTKSLGTAATPVEKGQAGESFVQNWIRDHFPTATVSSSSKTSHGCDLIVSLRQHNCTLKLMIEVKNKRDVPLTDRDKFERDCSENKYEVDAAILLSIQDSVSISNRGNLVQMAFLNIPVLYLSQMLTDAGRSLMVAIEMLFFIKQGDRCTPSDSTMKLCAELCTEISKHIQECHKNISKGVLMIETSNSQLSTSLKQSEALKAKLINHTLSGPHDVRVTDKRPRVENSTK